MNSPRVHFIPYHGHPLILQAQIVDIITLRRPMLTVNDIAVVIPALNEELRIRGVVDDALRYCPTVIVVDDGSTDATLERIAGLNVTVVRHPERMGKGASLRDGFAKALELGKQGVVTMDGDGQHAGHDIPRLLAAANQYPNHIVIGARLKKRALQPKYRTMANHFGDWGIAWGTGYQIADTQSGQRFYPANVMALQDVPAEGFVFEAEILISAAQHLGTRVVSVPIESRYSSQESEEEFRASHFRPLHDLFGITSHVVRRVLSSRSMVDTYREIRRHPPVIFDPPAND